MITVNIEIEDELKTFEIPENWGEVTVEHFCQLFSIDRTNITDYELTLQTLKILTGIDDELIQMMEYSDVIKIIDVLSFTLGEITPTPVEYIEVNGDKYYMKTDFDKMKYGEIMSVELLMASSGGNLLRVMDKLLCIFLRQKNENGKLESFKADFMERAESFKKIPISQVNQIFTFFLLGNEPLPKTTRVSSEKKKTPKPKRKVNSK